MELIASGRDSDIFDYAPGLILRRSRRDRSLADEARVMEWAHEHGYPVPRVEAVRAGGNEIVMERVDGRMMMDEVMRDPRKLAAGARMLADLHDQLHEIRAPEWLRHIDGADRLLHLDLHPMNVMIAGDKPVVIDWSNAAAGDPLTDVALSYVMLQCPEAPVPRAVQIAIQPVRLWLARSFARRYRGRAFDEHVLTAGELKRLDPNMSPTEVARIARLEAKVKKKMAPG